MGKVPYATRSSEEANVHNLFGFDPKVSGLTAICVTEPCMNKRLCHQRIAARFLHHSSLHSIVSLPSKILIYTQLPSAADMHGRRVAFTGGSGKVGRHVIKSLLQHGHQVINLDISDFSSSTLSDPNFALLKDVHTVKCDLTDSGQVFSALNTHMTLGEPFPAERPRPVDAVIHFAGMSKPMAVSDGETFGINVMGTHNVIEAACKLGIKKVIIASSVTVYGVAFGQGDLEYPSFPVTEEVATSPTDPYALSKLCAERVAQSYAARFGVDVYCFRIGRVFVPDEYDSDMFWGYVYEPEKWFQHGWSYTDARDLGLMCYRGIEVSGLGFQIFNAVNTTITNTSEDIGGFLKSLYPTVPHTRDMDSREAPISNRKIREMLGFEEEHNWRKYFTRWEGNSEQ